MRRLYALLPLVLLVAGPLGTAAGATVPDSSQGTIQHVIIIVQENHTFDNYFGTYPGANGIQNDPPGVRTFLITGQLRANLCHSVACAHASYDNGKMDNFANGEGSNMTFGYYPQKAIPYYWSLAQEYTLYDNFFSSVMGPSLPNHVALIQANSGGSTTNEFKVFRSNPVMTLLDLAGVSWRYYAGYAPGYSGWNPLPGYPQFYTRGWNNKLFDSGQVLTDVKDGNLPQVSWVMPPNDSASDHPPYPIVNGEKWVQDVITTVQHSAYWSSTAIFLTWDDYGGWYDHVSPPQNSGFGDGFRVPLLLVSPFAKNGYVDHTLGDFSSLVRFIENTFNLQSLGNGDSTANDLTDGLKLGTPDYGQALTLTSIKVSHPGGVPLLNLTYFNGYFMNIRGNVTASVTEQGNTTVLSQASALLSVNPSRSQSVVLAMPSFPLAGTGNYTVTVSVVDPGGQIASGGYALLLWNSSSVDAGPPASGTNVTSDS